MGLLPMVKFVVGKVAYTTVVLPPMMETLNKPTFDLLQNFVQQGGRVITFLLRRWLTEQKIQPGRLCLAVSL